MRYALIALLALTACSEPYRYEKRGEDLIRIHKRTGETEILKRGSYGVPDRWAKVASVEEMAEREKARQRALAAQPSPSPTSGTPRFYRPAQ